MFNYINFNSNNFNTFYFLFLFLFIFIYFVNILALLLIFENKYLKTNNYLKFIKLLFLKKKNIYFLLIIFGSLIGIPPLSGFISKFFLLFLLSFKYKLFNLIIIYIYAVFSVFFYLQFLKLINKEEILDFNLVKIKTKKKNTKHKNLTFYKHFILIFFLFFSLFFLFFFKDFFFIFYFFLV